MEEGEGDINMKPTDLQMWKAARKKYEQAGEIEIDDGALISRGTGDGAYVHAWVWVYDSEAENETA
jgi:hypothetical protein